MPEQEAIPLVSRDEQGYPHVALLSFLEFLLFNGELYFFLSNQSQSAANLQKRISCTALFLSPEHVYYLKGKAVFALLYESQSVFRLELTAVHQDFPEQSEGATGLMTGLTFGLDPAHLRDKLTVRNRIQELLVSRVSRRV